METLRGHGRNQVPVLKQQTEEEVVDDVVRVDGLQRKSGAQRLDRPRLHDVELVRIQLRRVVEEGEVVQRVREDLLKPIKLLLRHFCIRSLFHFEETQRSWTTDRIAFYALLSSSPVRLMHSLDVLMYMRITLT